ncbi:MAG: GAF domain-containing protein [Chloroflexi bacterium]|nr:GAF domain-containing protein [Chloroflexota bacterium]
MRDMKVAKSLETKTQEADGRSKPTRGKWSIAVKLTIASIMMIVLTLLAGGAGLWQVLLIGQAVDEAHAKEQQRAWSLELLASGHRLVAALDRMVLTEDPLLASTEVVVSLGSLSFYVETLQESGEEMGTYDLGEMQMAYDELRQAVSEVDVLARQELWTEAGTTMEQKVRPANEYMALLIRRLVYQVDQDASAVALRAQLVVRQASGLLVVIVVLTTGIALGWRQFVFRGLGLSITELRQGVARISSGDLEYKLYVRTGDEIEELGDEFNKMADELAGVIGSLEQRVAERTADLERRSAYLEASAEVAHAATSILNPDQLIQQTVELIRERFGFYYVGLFQLDERREWAVLRAGTGEAGRAMLARGHRMRIGEGMIGWSIANAQARIALDVGEDAVRLATTELADTRSEAALPLRSRGQVLGALSVQDDQPDAFDEDILTVLQTMADQVAIALDNARLLAESQKALMAERRVYGESSRRVWAEMLGARADWGYLYAGHAVAPSTGDWRPEMVQAAETGQTVQSIEPAKGENGAGEPTLVIPLRARDQVVGALRFQKGESDQAWTAEEVALLEILTEQLGVTLESARLYQDTQRRAARERLTGEITTRMRETLDMDTVLRTAVREVRQALGLPEVVVRLAVQPAGEAGNGAE